MTRNDYDNAINLYFAIKDVKNKIDIIKSIKGVDVVATFTDADGNSAKCTDYMLIRKILDGEVKNLQENYDELLKNLT